MKLLFALRHSGYLRHFSGALQTLADRGHQIVLLSDGRVKSGNDLADLHANELAADPRINTVYDRAPAVSRGDLGVLIRAWMNHLRYLEPAFDAARSPLHLRAARDLPPGLVEDDVAHVAADPAYPRRQREELADLERRLPVDPAAVELLQEVDPDVVAVTPLIERGEPQLRYLRAAARLGIPRAVLIASWDNMTTSGLLHDLPDRVVVWNAAQRREAVELMDIPAERITVTGAPGFDVWFGREPSRDRDSFCAGIGLPDAGPFILYVGSSGFITPHEERFAVDWLERIRSSENTRLREANVVFRPHPFNPMARAARLAEVVAADERAVIHPEGGTVVFGEPARNDYFDSLAHAAVVVGINTSALIEAAIAGTPVLAPPAKRYSAAQRDSPHFQHLLREGGGLIDQKGGMNRHFKKLARAVQDGPGAADAERSRRFVRAFVRPFGLSEPASPRVAAVLEELAAQTVDAVPPPSPPDPATIERVRALLGATAGAPPQTPLAAELLGAADQRRRALVRISTPLALIGQLQRCGGTLLNTLLDGHPMMHSHPHELHIGAQTKYEWPTLDLTATPEDWLEALRERAKQRMFHEGYQKAGARLAATSEHYEPLPFLLPPALLASIFLDLVDEAPPTTQREVLNHYFTAFFNAWLDHPTGENARAKRWITGFGPRLGWQPSRFGFFDDYPDGRLLLVARDPRAWYASASVHKSYYEDLEDALALWSRNSEETTKAKSERPEQVFITTYEALTLRTEDTMRALANWLAIDWDPVLLVPTFNRRMVRANTSFEAAGPGVVTTSVERWRQALPAETIAAIEERALPTYEHIRDDVADFA